MNAILSEGNVVRTAKKILVVTGLASLAFVLAGPTWAQSKPAQTETAPAQSAAAAPETSLSGKSSSVGSSAQAGAEKTTQAVAQSPSAEPRPPKGQHESITIHGHWIIDVKNPDGRLVRHVEFENSLVPNSGPAVLSSLLGGNNSSGQSWAIVLVGSPQPCVNAGQPSPCSIGPVGYCTSCGSAAFNTLSIVSGGTTFTLNGSITAGENGQISTVLTEDALCPASVAPTSCSFAAITPGSPFQFTSSTSFQGAPITVTSGQTVQVTVTISFQ